VGEWDGAGGEGFPPAALCFFCGDPEMLEISEMWSDGNFALDSCCSSLLECVAAEMHDDPKWAEMAKVPRA